MLLEDAELLTAWQRRQAEFKARRKLTGKREADILTQLDAFRAKVPLDSGMSILYCDDMLDECGSNDVPAAASVRERSSLGELLGYCGLPACVFVRGCAAVFAQPADQACCRKHADKTARKGFYCKETLSAIANKLFAVSTEVSCSINVTSRGGATFLINSACHLAGEPRGGPPGAEQGCRGVAVRARRTKRAAC